MGAVGSCVLPRDDPNPAVLWERGMSTKGMLGTQVARPAGDGKSPSYFQSGGFKLVDNHRTGAAKHSLLQFEGKFLEI